MLFLPAFQLSYKWILSCRQKPILLPQHRFGMDHAFAHGLQVEAKVAVPSHVRLLELLCPKAELWQGLGLIRRRFMNHRQEVVTEM